MGQWSEFCSKCKITIKEPKFIDFNSKDGIIRETGVLMSAGSNINNNSKVSTTLLNVIINGKVE